MFMASGFSLTQEERERLICLRNLGEGVQPPPPCLVLSNLSAYREHGAQAAVCQTVGCDCSILGWCNGCRTPCSLSSQLPIQPFLIIKIIFQPSFFSSVFKLGWEGEALIRVSWNCTLTINTWEEKLGSLMRSWEQAAWRILNWALKDEQSPIKSSAREKRFQACKWHGGGERPLRN